MQSRDLIRRNLEMSRDRALARIEDMRDHCMVAPTPRGGGHTLWVLGHMAYLESRVIQSFMLGKENPLGAWSEIFDGGDISSDPEAFPPFDEVLAKCREVRRATLKVLEGLSEEDLDRPGARVPEGWEDMFGTYRSCFQAMADHWFMHRGQLADARRAAGVERMWV